MPFYEYECKSCGEQTEVLQKISDKPLRKCPACGKSALIKLVSAPIFRLKGGGWYETDFKSEQDKKRNLAGDEPKSEAKPEPKSEAKTESKSEPKAEPKADPKAEPKAEPKAKPRAEPKAKPARSAKSRKGK